MLDPEYWANRAQELVNEARKEQERKDNIKTVIIGIVVFIGMAIFIGYNSKK